MCQYCNIIPAGLPGSSVQPVSSFDEEPVRGAAGGGAQPWPEDDLIEDDLEDSDEEDLFKNQN